MLWAGAAALTPFQHEAGPLQRRQCSATQQTVRTNFASHMPSCGWHLKVPVTLHNTPKYVLVILDPDDIFTRASGLAGTHLSREKEAGGMRTKQPKKAADIVHELEHMDVLAMPGVNQVRVCTRHSSKNDGHHDEREDGESSSAKPSVVHNISSSIVAHQLHLKGSTVNDPAILSTSQSILCVSWRLSGYLGG